MSLHYKTEQRFTCKQVEVKALCELLFGPARKKTHDRLSGKIRDNHGNWVFCDWTNGSMIDHGIIKFRYQKDLTWFLLQASHLADPPKNPGRWPY
jgi:hypothetical protein